MNTGKFVGRKNLEDTVSKNKPLKAVKEIAYQLRLRNCGGIIIIDFIDMESAEHRDAVYSAFAKALKKGQIKNKRTSYFRIRFDRNDEKTNPGHPHSTPLCSPCPYCEGTGRVKLIITICYELIRELCKVLERLDSGKACICAPRGNSALMWRGFGYDSID